MPSRRLLHGLAMLLPLSLSPARALGVRHAPPRACTAPEHHQFDFWIGTWDVTQPGGARAGANRIEPILGGCALRESWTGAGGSHGTSYNAYDAGRRRWHQTWVDDQGTVLLLDGKYADDRMTLEGETLDTAGHPQRQRIIWEQTAPGRVRQLWQTSSDSGATWITAFDGRYVKR